MNAIILESLFKEFSKYLNNYDNFSDDGNYSDNIISNNLANVNKNMRKKYHYWKLNVDYSIRYCDNEEFQNMVQSRLTNVYKQLLLHICNPYDYSCKLPILNLHSLRLNNSLQLNNSLRLNNTINIKILNLSYTHISDLSIFQNSKIYNLSLNWCYYISNEQLQYITYSNFESRRMF